MGNISLGGKNLSTKNKRKIFFLWRPVLKDPRDESILEVAVESRSEYIVTFNLRHFIESKQFGIKALRPRNFLEEIGELS